MVPIKIGQTVYFSAFLFNGAAVLTGKTVNLSIRRMSDGQYWNGTTFQASYTTVSMTEQTGNDHLEGEYQHNWTHPSADGENVYSWSVKYTEAGFLTYFKGQLQSVRWPVNVEQISSDATAADNAEAFFDGTGYAGGTIKLDTNVSSMSNNTVTSNALAANAVAEIADGVWDEDRATHTTAGSFGQGVASVQGNVTGSVGSVATDGITSGSLAASAITEIQTGLSTLTASQVNAEIVDVLTVDTFAELSSVPTFPATILNMLKWVFTLGRHRNNSTSGQHKVFKADTSTILGTSTVSDDGTTGEHGAYS